MLYTQTVSGETLELLKRLMGDERLPKFRLVGGTALALQIGHRKSVDLDLFTDDSFDEQQLREYMERAYGLHTEFMDKETLKGEIKGVQIDCIAHHYPWIGEAMEDDGIRLASIEDICAMKLNAIAGNGTRIKDFIDVAYLSKQFSLRQMLSFFEAKYNANPIMAAKALTYFDDINLAEPVMMLNGKLNWKEIEKTLKRL